MYLNCKMIKQVQLLPIVNGFRFMLQWNFYRLTYFCLNSTDIMQIYSEDIASHAREILEGGLSYWINIAFLAPTAGLLMKIHYVVLLTILPSLIKSYAIKTGSYIISCFNMLSLKWRHHRCKCTDAMMSSQGTFHKACFIWQIWAWTWVACKK